MKSRHLLGGLLSIILLIFAALGQSTQPAAPSVESPSPQQSLTDDQIGISIHRAADFLLSKFDSTGKLGDIAGTTSQNDHDGLDALCVYALLQAGQATDDPRLHIRDARIRQLIEQLKQCPLRTDPAHQTPVTYARSLRAAALSIYNRPEDHQTLQEDATWLLHAHREGAYTYDDYWPNPVVTYVATTNPSAPAYTLGPGVYIGPRPIAATGGVVYGGRIDLCTPSRPRAMVQVTHAAAGSRSGAPAPHGTISRQVAPSPSAQPPAQPGTPSVAKTAASASGSPGTAGPAGSSPLRNPGVGVLPPNGVLGVGPDGYQPQNNVQLVPQQSPLPWDNSNSQFGAFGVYSAALAGIEVPNSYWSAVDRHWASCQEDDGRWGYSAGDTEPSQSMTCAGLASFLVTLDRLSNTMPPRQLGNPALTPRMAKAMDWLCASDNSTTLLGPLTRYVSYNLFTLERVGLDSGYKFFGNHDWYRELATRVISVQWPNGAFGRNVDGYDTVVETAFTLAFLSRGRSPVIMEKLQFAGDWNNRPRDLANATRFASRALERPLNWEVVPLNRDWHDWLDSPLMYIASDHQPNFSDADIDKLRNYINSGGTLFTHSDAGSKAFSDYIEKSLATKLFPQSQMQPVPADDPIYSILYPLNARVSGIGVRVSGKDFTQSINPKPDTRNPTPDVPPLMGIRNNTRWLLLHSESDLSLAWQNRTEKSLPQNFQLATNLFVYAAGKSTIRNRIAAPTTAPTTQAVGT